MKKFSVKKFLISTLAGAGVVCAGTSVALLSGNSSSVAQAAQTEEPSFEMMGAAVRTAEMDGIRFIAQVSDESREAYGEGAKCGVIMIPADMDTSADLTITYADGNYTTSNSYALVVEAKDWWSEEACEKNGVKEGYSAFSSALVAAQEGETITQFPAAFYNRPITAVGYIVAEDGSIVYTEKMTRSIAYVATVESLKPTYEANEVVERIVEGTTYSFSVNGGETLTNLYKPYAPILSVGGMEASSSDLVSVTYTSSSPEVAEIVDGKVKPTGDGETTITATVSAGGEDTVSVSVNVNVDVTREREWVVVNDATGDFSAYSSGTTTSGQSTAADPVGTGFIKVTSNADGGWFFLPLKEEGVVYKASGLVDKFTAVKFNLYVPNTLSGNLVCNAGLMLAAGTPQGFYEVEFPIEQVVVNYNDVGGMSVEIQGGSETVYFGEVTAFTAEPNYNPEKLATPVVAIWDDGTATWSPVEGATAYAVAVDGLNFTVTNATSIKLDGKSVVKVKALGDGLYYKDSAYSQSVAYYQKDVLNSCEDAASIIAEGVTKSISAEHVFEGNYSVTMTSESAPWSFSVAIDGAPTLAKLREKYKKIVFNVHSTYPDMEGIGAANTFLYNNDWSAVITWLGYGDNVVSLDTATIPETAYENGLLTFTLGGACSLTIDNVIGVATVDAAKLDTSADMLNNCETVQWWVEAYSATSPTVSSTSVFEGNTSVEATGLADGWVLNVRIQETSPTLEELKAKYETIKLNVYSSYPGTNSNNLWLGDAADYDDWISRIVAQLSQGDNVVRIPTSILDETMYIYTEEGGGWLTFRVGGACTLRVDNVVGTKTPYFGNAFIIGDSYSTFEGWIPYDEWSFYFDDDEDVNAVEKTWWHQVLSATGSNLIYNNAIGGTTIGYTGYKENGVYQDYKPNSFITRFIQEIESGNLKDNHVDTIFIFGGTNDAWAEAPLGTPKYGNWTEADLYNVYPALSYLIKTIHDYLPNAKIVVLGNTWGYERYITGEYNATNAGMSDTFGEIVAHYKAEGFDVDYIPIYLTDAHIANNHPNSEGMTLISDTILNYYN